MSERSPEARRPSGRDRVRAQLSNFNRSREQRMLGSAEIIALAGSALILLLVVVSYLYFLAPANSRRDALQLERSRLQALLRTSQDAVRQGQTTEAAVQKITQSLDDFENNQLVGASRGRMSLYDSLNSLIRKNGLRNTSGPTYTPLEPAGPKAGATGRTTSTKWQSIYPGIAISVTVEGQYPNLRRFIQELEMNKQFVIINSVELERSTETNAAPAAEGAPTDGTGASALVSLRLEMATYFQRGSQTETATN